MPKISPTIFCCSVNSRTWNDYRDLRPTIHGKTPALQSLINKDASYAGVSYQKKTPALVFSCKF